MAVVNETIVREYFEAHGFLVRQQRKYVSPSRVEGEDIDFFILNPQPGPASAPLPFVLNSADLSAIRRGIVGVKGWHTDVFSAAVLANAPEIFRFAEPAVFQRAEKAFEGDGPVIKILIVPALPPGAKARDESIALMREKGIDAVIPFRTLLADLIQRTEANRNYEKSDFLQTLRVLKSYDFLKDPQLELFKQPRRRRTAPKE